MTCLRRAQLACAEVIGATLVVAGFAAVALVGYPHRVAGAMREAVLPWLIEELTGAPAHRVRAYEGQSWH